MKKIQEIDYSKEIIHVVEKTITFQGEIFSGQRVFLLRFKDCNRVKGISSFGDKIKPCPFCDTFEKMNTLEDKEVSIQDIRNIVSDNQCDIMLTGGEPTFGRNFEETLKIIEYTQVDVQIETNGFDLLSLVSKIHLMASKSEFYIPELIDLGTKYVFSPKIFSFKELKECINIAKELNYNNHFYVKLVYQESPYIITFLQEISKLDMNNRVYLMPEGKDKEELLRNTKKVLEVSNQYHFNFSSRLHILHNFV